MKAYEYLLSRPLLASPQAIEAAWEIANRAPEAVQARQGKPMDGTRTAERRENVAVVPVIGPIFRYADMFTDLCGGVTVEHLARDITTALDDPTCSAIVLEIDSPGGEAAGIGELAAMIRQGTARKPIVAYAGNQCASAAYWIASACSEVVAAPAAMLGSIGVVMGCTVKAPRAGETRYQFVSSQSPGKRPDLATEGGRSQVQELVDKLATVFISAVADYRGVTPEAVASDFGKGGELVGQHAVDARMADRLGSLESVLADLQSSDRDGDGPRSRTSALSSPPGEPFMASLNPFKALAALWDKDPAAAEAAVSHGAAPDMPTFAGMIQPPPAAKPLAEAPEFQAMQAEIARLKESNTSLQTARLQADADRIEVMANAFIQGELVAGRLLQPEATALKSSFIQAAQDDAAHPLPAGSRTQNLRDITAQRPSHGMFDNRASGQPLPGNVFAIGQRPEAAGPEQEVNQDEVDRLLGLTSLGRASLARNKTA